jgi:hypothetical protein
MTNDESNPNAQSPKRATMTLGQAFDLFRSIFPEGELRLYDMGDPYERPPACLKYRFRISGSTEEWSLDIALDDRALSTPQDIEMRIREARHKALKAGVIQVPPDRD